jgi:hypothetical protein
MFSPCCSAGIAAQVAGSFDSCCLLQLREYSSDYPSTRLEMAGFVKLADAVSGSFSVWKASR